MSEQPVSASDVNPSSEILTRLAHRLRIVPAEQAVPDDVLHLLRRQFIATHEALRLRDANFQKVLTMPAKGSTEWYRRHAAFDAAGDQAKLEARRTEARARGEFDALSERSAFEAFFRESRSGKGASYLTIALRRHPTRPLEYEAEPTQRHWHTWQMAVGGGRLLPRYDMYKAAADRLSTQAAPAAAPTGAI